MGKQVAVACISCTTLFALEWLFAVVNVHVLLELGLVHETPDGDTDGTLERLLSLRSVHVPDVALVVRLAEYLATVLARHVVVSLVHVPAKWEKPL